MLSRTDSLDLLASLTDIAPFLSPAKVTIRLIAQALDRVEDNQNQCFYLFQRSTDICLQINRLCVAHNVSDHLIVFFNTLENIRCCVVGLSKKTLLQRFLQRKEISDSIGNAHRSLDSCVEIFHLQSVMTLTSVTAHFEEARRCDQAQLAFTLNQLQNNDDRIVEALNVQSEQLVDAIRGLQNSLRRGIDDDVQRQFASSSLQILTQRADGDSTPFRIYDWALSPLEILIETEMIGKGASGTVYVGRWDGRRVAVKKLTRETKLLDIGKEIEIWRSMKHPHVARFFGASIDSQPPLLVSELYRYGNAMDFLSKFPGHNRVVMCLEISQGMQFLHSKKVVHGDLKPANILVDDACRARIADFGLSKISSQSSQPMSNELLNQTPVILGTKPFMAPESLCSGKRTFATDVYAFSMSAYQIFTDEAPFQYLQESEFQQVVVIKRERPEKPEEEEFVQRGLTGPMWGLLQDGWAHQSTQRPKFERIAEILKSLVNSSASVPPYTVTVDGTNIPLAGPVADGHLSSIPEEMSPGVSMPPVDFAPFNVPPFDPNSRQTLGSNTTPMIKGAPNTWPTLHPRSTTARGGAGNLLHPLSTVKPQIGSTQMLQDNTILNQERPSTPSTSTLPSAVREVARSFFPALSGKATGSDKYPRTSPALSCQSTARGGAGNMLHPKATTKPSADPRQSTARGGAGNILRLKIPGTPPTLSQHVATGQGSGDNVSSTSEHIPETYSPRTSEDDSLKSAVSTLSHQSTSVIEPVSPNTPPTSTSCQQPSDRGDSRNSNRSSGVWSKSSRPRTAKDGIALASEGSMKPQ